MRVFKKIVTTLLFLVLPTVAIYAEEEYITISFLDHIDNSGGNLNMGENEIRGMMEDNGAFDWISSIESTNVGAFGGELEPGIRFKASATESAKLKFNMNDNKRLKLKKIKFYCVNKENNSEKLKVIINNDIYYTTTSVTKATSDYAKNWPKDVVDLRNAVAEDASASVALKCYVSTSEFNPLIPLNNFEIVVEPYYANNGYNTNIVNMLAIRLFYDGVEENIEDSVEMLEYDENQAVEYFNLQGQKLSSAPSSGIYICRSAGKIKKLIAK